MVKRESAIAIILNAGHSVYSPADVDIDRAGGLVRGELESLITSSTLEGGEGSLPKARKGKPHSTRAVGRVVDDLELA